MARPVIREAMPLHWQPVRGRVDVPVDELVRKGRGGGFPPDGLDLQPRLARRTVEEELLPRHLHGQTHAQGEGPFADDAAAQVAKMLRNLALVLRPDHTRADLHEPSRPRGAAPQHARLERQPGRRLLDVERHRAVEVEPAPHGARRGRRVDEPVARLGAFLQVEAAMPHALRIVGPEIDARKVHVIQCGRDVVIWTNKAFNPVALLRKPRRARLVPPVLGIVEVPPAVVIMLLRGRKRPRRGRRPCPRYEHPQHETKPLAHTHAPSCWTPEADPSIESPETSNVHCQFCMFGTICQYKT